VLLAEKKGVHRVLEAQEREKPHGKIEGKERSSPIEYGKKSMRRAFSPERGEKPEAFSVAQVEEWESMGKETDTEKGVVDRFHHWGGGNASRLWAKKEKKTLRPDRWSQRRQ